MLSSVSAGVLVLTDLTAASDVPLRVAGRLAEGLGCRLDVLYAMGITGRPLTEAVPVLEDLEARIGAIDRSLRAQVEAQSLSVRAGAGVIDFDAPSVAVPRRIRQLSPHVVVLPAGEVEEACGGATDGWWCVGVPPVLLAGGSLPVPGGRVMVVGAPEWADAVVPRSAVRWSEWLLEVWVGRVPGVAAREEIVVVDAADRARAPASWCESASLVVIPAPVMAGSTGVREVVRAAAAAAVPVLVVSREAADPPEPNAESDPSVVLVGGSSRGERT